MNTNRHNRRRFLLLGAGAAGFAALGASAWLRGNASAGAQPGSAQLFTRSSWALGTDVSLSVLHTDEAVARRALEAAFAELDAVENALSLYRPHSELSRFNRDGFLNKPSAHFSAVLNESLELARRSNGAFDVTVQPYWELYSAAQKSGRLPSAEELEAAREKVGWNLLEVSNTHVASKRGLARITFNGIAQGYAADRVLEVLKAHGIASALIDTGEFEALGRKADGHAFRCGIQHPRKPNELSAVCTLEGRALATSGDYATHFSDDFVYNHIFNPRTGRSPLECASVSIIAPSAMLADGLSTALFVLGREAGLEWLKTFPGCEAYLIDKAGTVTATPGFPLSA